MENSLRSLRCLKTGCDLSCGGIKWHGDLYLAGSVLILAGFRGHTDSFYDSTPPMVVAGTAWMGEDSTGVVVIGPKPRLASPELRSQLARYEPGTLSLFAE